MDIGIRHDKSKRIHFLLCRQGCSVQLNSGQLIAIIRCQPDCHLFSGIYGNMTAFVISRIVGKRNIMEIIDSFYGDHFRSAMLQIRIRTIVFFGIGPGNGVGLRIYLNHISLLLIYQCCGIFRSSCDIPLKHLFCRIILYIYACGVNSIVQAILSVSVYLYFSLVSKGCQ